MIGVNRKTALLLQQKVRQAMKCSENYLLEGEIEIDAFIGQKEEDQIDRRLEEKAQIVLVLEKNGTTGVKRMYARKIDNASTDELKVIFENQIS